VILPGNTIINTIQEGVNTGTTTLTGGATAGPYTIVYNNALGGTIYAFAAAQTANYALNVGYLPSVTDTGKTYVISILNPYGNTYMCNTISVGTAATYTQIPLFFSGGNVVAGGTATGYSTQQIAFVYSASKLVALSTFINYA
jgi:hypothetical protein